jgi:CRP-like cAMP-binding protein
MKFNVEDYYLKSNSLFRFLDAGENKTLKRKSTRRIFRKNEFLIRENGYSKGVFVVLKGKVKIFQVSHDGKQSIVYIYSKGDFFGYRPLLAYDPNPVSAVAMEDTEVSFIPKELFLKLLNDSPTFSRKLLVIMAQEFSVWINKLTVFSHFGVKERLAMSLLILEKIYKKQADNDNSISINRDDFSGFVGTAKETLVRMLRRFKDDKIISSRGSKITILKHKALYDLIADI